MTALFLRGQHGDHDHARNPRAAPAGVTYPSRLPCSVPSLFYSAADIAPFPHDPIRYAELQLYAGHEVLRGRMRAVVSGELFAATCDRSGHDVSDEDGAR